MTGGTGLTSPSPQERWAKALRHLREAQRLKRIQSPLDVPWQVAGEARGKMINECIALAEVLTEMDQVGLLDALPDYLDIVYR